MLIEAPVTFVRPNCAKKKQWVPGGVEPAVNNLGEIESLQLLVKGALGNSQSSSRFLDVLPLC